jgi:hypothetical protein
LIGFVDSVYKQERDFHTCSFHFVPHLEELFLEDCSPGVKSCAEQNCPILGAGNFMVHFSLFGLFLGSACGTVVVVFELAMRRGYTNITQ